MQMFTYQIGSKDLKNGESYTQADRGAGREPGGASPSTVPSGLSSYLGALEEHGLSTRRPLLEVHPRNNWLTC